MRGRVRSCGSINSEALESIRSNLVRKGRSAATVDVEIVDDAGNVGLYATVEWFIRLTNTLSYL